MKIGRYRIQRQIAEGGQGSVLLGYDPRLRRCVAIKLYRLPDQRESRRQALREARRSALPDSPRITRVYDVLVAGRDLAVIMEYVPGCDLRDVLRGTRLSLTASLAIASDVAAALAAARLCEIVHGDIKPANILINTSGRAVLTDFGVAQVGARSGAAGVSESALTPEHVRGESLSPASDMFALGVLLYTMVSGSRPFAAGEAGRHAMCEARFVPLAQRVGDGSVPHDLDVLVTRLLAPHPRRRPDSIHAVRQALRRIALALPLGDSAPVRAETEAFYRSESAADVPPRLAVQFGDESRRRQSLRTVRTLSRHYPLATASILVSLLLAGAAAWTLRPGPCIELQSPELRVDVATTISADVSREWLQSGLHESVLSRLAQARVVGELGAPASQVISRAAAVSACTPGPGLQLRLQCRQGMCLLALARDGAASTPGVPLFAEASSAEWRHAIDHLVAASLR